MEHLTFHAGLPYIELQDILLQGVHNEHEVITMEELPWHASTKLTQKRHTHHGEGQWAKDRGLIYIQPNTKLLTVLTIDPHIPSIGVHAVDNMHSPFPDTEAPQVPLHDLSKHIIECFLNVDKSKIEQFVGGYAPLLQLANNEDGICCASTRHNAELHFVGVHNLADLEV